MAWRMTDKTNAQLQADRDDKMKALVGSLIKTDHDSLGEVGEVFRVDRKPGFSDLYEVEYRYLSEHIKCTCQFNAAIYAGVFYSMKLIGGRGGHWVKDKAIEILSQSQPVQMSLF